MASILTEHLLTLGRLYRGARNIALATISERAMGDSGLLPRLAKGTHRSFTIAKYDRGVAWFAQNWPTDVLVWPPQIHRPSAEEIARSLKRKTHSVIDRRRLAKTKPGEIQP